MVETSFHYGFARFEVQGQHPDELIRATMKNETVVWAAGLSAVRRPPPHRHGRADAGSSSAGPPLPPPPAAPSHGPAADDCADADSTRGRRARECIVCMDGTRTHAFMPCGHWCACGQCAAVLHAAGTGCPMCRRGIASVARIYDMEGRDNAGANSSGAAEATDAEQLPILILD